MLGRYPGATLEVITDIFMRNTAAATVERLGGLAVESNVRMHWVGVPAFKFQANIRPELEALHERFKDEGRDIWTGFHHVSPTSMMNFISSLVFSQNGNPVWQEMVNAEGEEAKLKMLADPAWRERALQVVEQPAPSLLPQRSQRADFPRERDGVHGYRDHIGGLHGLDRDRASLRRVGRILASQRRGFPHPEALTGGRRGCRRPLDERPTISGEHFGRRRSWPAVLRRRGQRAPVDRLRPRSSGF